MVHLRPSLTGTIDGDENVSRGNWSRQLDFLLSCLGYAVGLGNVWRFPHLSYSNGGGAFFIPYFLMAVFVGMPLFFLELSIGQFSSSGPITAYKYCPLVSGIGIGMVTVSALVCTYYNVIIAWAVYYLFASFRDPLPWSTCGNKWNSDMCSNLWPKVECDGADEVRQPNGTCFSDAEHKYIGLYDVKLADSNNITRILASEEYFFNEALKASASIDTLGDMNWFIFLSLCLAWAMVYFSLIKGVKSSGKVVYFTALFPYIVLITLLIRGLILEGAGEGIKFYLTPVWSKLKQPEVWSAAGGQIFYSLSVCWGGLMTLASYNRFHNNVLKDTLIVTIGNCLTSIFAGFVIYSYIGHLAHILDSSVEKVSKGGLGLAFIIYPASVLTLPFPPFWSVIFFSMLITLGLDSQFTLLETITTMVFDVKPDWRERKSIVTLGCCAVFFIPGAFMCTQGGIHILDLIDSYSAGFNLMILGAVELFSVQVLYGYKRFANDIKLMIGKEISPWWRFCWQLAGPIMLGFVTVMALLDIKSNTAIPKWAEAVGWLLAMTVLAWFPGVAIYRLIRAPGDNFIKKLKYTVTPEPAYGPALWKYRAKVTYVPGFVIHSSDENIGLDGAPPMAEKTFGKIVVPMPGQELNADPTKAKSDVEAPPISEKSNVNDEKLLANEGDKPETDVPVATDAEKPVIDVQATADEKQPPADEKQAPAEGSQEPENENKASAVDSQAPTADDKS